MRKPIQVSVTGVEHNQATQASYMVVVLCDDGTLWQSMDSDPWQQLQPIPQDDASKES